MVAADSTGSLEICLVGIVSEGIVSGTLFSIVYSSREACNPVSAQPPVNSPVISSDESMTVMVFFFIFRFPLSMVDAQINAVIKKCSFMIIEGKNSVGLR